MLLCSNNQQTFKIGYHGNQAENEMLFKVTVFGIFTILLMFVQCCRILKLQYLLQGNSF